MLHRPARAVGAALAALLGFTLMLTAPAQSAPSGGSGGAFTDRTFQSFTASNGLSSQYHIYAAGQSSAQPSGLVLQFHGDGAYDFKNPSSSYALGGSSGIVAEARERDFITVSALAPDTSGSITWWESGSANADYVRDLLTKVTREYNIDSERIWLVGYSGGAQFITQFFLPKYSSMIDGGGSVVFGGGGVPRVSAQPFAADLRADFPMHWYTGTADNGAGGSYNALRDARNGSAWYEGKGFATSIETPAGVGHGLSGKFGGVVAQQLDRHDGGVSSAAPAPAPAPEPTEDPEVAPQPAPEPEQSQDAPQPEADEPAQDDAAGSAPAGPEPGSDPVTEDDVTVARTERGMVLEGTVGDRSAVTLRASLNPLEGQTGWYLTSTPSSVGDVRIELTKFSPGKEYYWQLEDADGAVLLSGQVPGEPGAVEEPATEDEDESADHVVTPTRHGVDLDLDVLGGPTRTTLRVSASPITSQSGWYKYTYATGADVHLSIDRSLKPGTTYYYQVESGTRSNVIAEGTFTTRD